MSDAQHPCALYHLVETWDGWEHWDTLHQVPGKLTWGAWAFAHASALTGHGPRPSDGAYVSWLNNGHMELLSDDDIEFVGGLLDRTEASAAALEYVHGPAIVYDRAAMERLAAVAPDDNIGEWIDDQAGAPHEMGRAGTAATRPEWLDGVALDTPLIAQTPVPDGDHARLLASETLAVFGRADAIDTAVATSLGIRPTGERQKADFWVGHGSADTPSFDRPYLPEHAVVDTDADTAVHYATAKTPVLTTHGSRLWWQPSDWSEPFNQFVPKYQVGSTYPVFRVAQLLSGLAADGNQPHALVAGLPHPFEFHAWRSAGVDHVLVGNLETGEFGDSRLPRQATIRLAVAQLALGREATALRRIDGEGADHVQLLAVADNPNLLEAFLTLPPESGAVYQVVSD